MNAVEDSAHACGRRSTVSRSHAMVLCAVILGAATKAYVQPRGLPSTFEAFITKSVRLDATEYHTLLSGNPVTKLLDSDPTQEVAVFGAIWIAASPAAYVRLVQDIEHFESGGAFHRTKRIGNPASIADFAMLELPEDDVRDLRDCRVGSCDVKLGADALRTLREEVDWGKPSANADVNAIFIRLAVKYVNGYLMGGNAELAIYRDKDRPR